MYDYHTFVRMMPKHTCVLHLDSLAPSHRHTYAVAKDDEWDVLTLAGGNT